MTSRSHHVAPGTHIRTRIVAAAWRPGGFKRPGADWMPPEIRKFRAGSCRLRPTQAVSGWTARAWQRAQASGSSEGTFVSCNEKEGAPPLFLAGRTMRCPARHRTQGPGGPVRHRGAPGPLSPPTARCACHRPSPPPAGTGKQPALPPARPSTSPRSYADAGLTTGLMLSGPRVVPAWAKGS